MQYRYTNTDLDVLQSIFQMAGNALGHLSPEKALPNKTYVESDEKPVDSEMLDNNEFIPGNPLALAKWIEAFDIALSRRLSNLSYAINVELLKVGIINSLLPITLLDAVNQGQMDNNSSISHLLKLKVPVQAPLSEEGMDISCILLSSSDFEFDDLKTRNCRTQLRQHRIEVLKMVRKQRHWQNRLISREVHQQWWQNPPDTMKAQ